MTISGCLRVIMGLSDITCVATIPIQFMVDGQPGQTGLTAV